MLPPTQISMLCVVGWDWHANLVEHLSSTACKYICCIASSRLDGFLIVAVDDSLHDSSGAKSDVT